MESDIALMGLMKLLVRGIWKIWGLWTKKVVEHFKKDLLDYSSKSQKGGAEADLNYDGPPREISAEKNVSKWLRPFL